MSTDVGRLILSHPDLGATKGAPLHAEIRTAWTKIGDHIPGRFFTASPVTGSGGTVDFIHNFSVDISELSFILYSLTTGPILSTKMVSGGTPDLDDFPITATPGSLTTSVRVTNNSGGDEDVSLLILHNGQASGSGGDPSFRVASLTAGGTIKYLAGTIGNDVDGVEYQIAADTTVDISGVVISNGDFNIYLDRELIADAAVVAGRKVVTIVPSTDFVYITTTNDEVDRIRFKHIGGLERTAGVFSNEYTASQNSKGGPAQLAAIEFEKTALAIGEIGSSDQFKGLHILDVNSFDLALASAVGSFWNLNADVNDDSGNGETLTNNGTTGFTATNILGFAFAAAALDGSAKYFSLAGAFIDTLSKAQVFAMGVAVKAADWTPGGGIDEIINIATDGTTPLIKIRIQTNGDVTLDDSSGTILTISNPGLIDGIYNHFAVVNDGTDWSLYINGALVGTVANSTGGATGSQTLGIGADGETGANGILGDVEQAFVIKANLGAKAIRKIAAARIDHDRRVAVVCQEWNATQDIVDGPTLEVEDYEAGRNENSLYVDFRALATTTLVALKMLNIGATGSVIAARSLSFEGTAAEIDALMPITHGLGSIPSITLEVEDSAGEFFEDDNGTYFLKSSTQIIAQAGESLTATYGAGTNIKLRLAFTPLPSALPAATTSTAGLREANRPLYRRLSGADTVFANEKLLVDNSGGAFALTLPGSPVDGDTIVFYDDTLSWGSFSLTLGRNGNLIQGAGADLVISSTSQTTARYTLIFKASSTDWRVYIS